mmetsp:Transcript_46810/g.94438  ORF Transcript_46810/g.94438 Transcript_46810/m.94438 type:complete len:623 (-) Transcript_46810:88-1956(-)
MLKDQKKRSPAVVFQRHPVISSGSLETVVDSLNKLHEDEIIQMHDRTSALEIRLRQVLAMAHDNAVGCGEDYEAALHRYERETTAARTRLRRSKLSQVKAAERLSAIRFRGTESTPALLSSTTGGLLSTLRAAGQPMVARQASPQVDSKQEEAECMQALDGALGQTKEDCDALLVQLQKQDQVRGGVALAFEACDARCRDAIADGIRAFLQIEIDATTKRLEDLKSLAGAVDSISSGADSKAFVAAAQRPDLTHSQSAALSLLHDPDNRGALVGVTAAAANETRRPTPASPQSSGSGHAESSALEEQVAGLSSDRIRTDVERITVALFAARQLNKWRIAKPEGQRSPEPLSPVCSPKNGDTDVDADPVELVAHPLEGPMANATVDDEPCTLVPLLTSNDRRRLETMLELEVGREALVHALNQQRSRRTEISGQGFAELAAALAMVLDKCRENRDVHTAKMAMMLSQTFWKNAEQSAPSSPTPPAPPPSTTPDSASSSAASASPAVPGTSSRGDVREYLKSALESHPLWQDMDFWEDACWESIKQSLKEGASDTAWHDMGPNETKDAVLRVHNIVFSQVGAYAHSMAEFGCDSVVASSFVRRLAATYQLAQDQLGMLLQLVGP